jgi:uncharacterized protein YukJ
MQHQRRKPAGARRTYGVLTGKIADGTLKRGGRSPHYEIWIKSAGADYRVAVNVRSVDGSEVLAHYDPDYTLPTKLDLPSLAAGPQGFKPLATGPGGAGMDYLRDGIFPIEKMYAVPLDGAGISMHQLLDAQIERAKADPEAVALAFGEEFHNGGVDETFGFSPEQGVHDIHMMQGNSGAFADDNRINGDGALFIRFTGGETVALFIRFATQATETDDRGSPA